MTDKSRVEVRPTPINVVRSPQGPVKRSKPRVPCRRWRLLRSWPIVDYLDTGEHCRYTTRLHWVSVARSLLKSLGVTMASFILSWGISIVTPGIWQIQALVWLGAVGHMGHTGWRVMRWRIDSVIVTDRRLLCARGIVTRQVIGWKLGRITNVDIEQSLLGQLLGYGSVRVESGGQHDDGAAREIIRFLPDPGLVARML